MPELPWGALLAGGGPWAIITLVVVCIIRGWLVPSSTVALLLQRAEDWRLVAERMDEARRVQAEQITQLLEVARTVDAVLRALPSPDGRVTEREPAP